MSQEESYQQELMKHMERCLEDRRYYFASHLNVINEQGKLATFGKLFPTQAKVQDIIDSDLAAGRPSRIIILKARRHRISTLMAANIFHACTFNENRRAYIVAHDVDTTDTLFRMHKVFYENLDEVVVPMVRFSNRKELLFENPDSESRRVNPGLRSSITVRSASSGAKRVSGDQGAAGVGRGDRIDILHGSEVAFWPNGQEIFTGFAQAVPEESGTMVAMESTANGMAGHFYHEWLRATSGDADAYTPVFIPWYEHPEYTATFVGRNRPEWTPTEDEFSMFSDWRDSLLLDHGPTIDRLGGRLEIDDEEEMLVRRFGINWDQLKWRRWCIRYRTRNAEVFHVEYPSFPEEAFASSGVPRFNNEKIRIWVNGCRMASRGNLVCPDDDWRWNDTAWKSTDVKFEPSSKGWLEMSDPPEKGHQYVIGADVGHGIGKDASTISVFDRTAKRFVAYMRDSSVKPDKLAERLVQSAWFYNEAYVVPEFNGPGVLTCHLIVQAGYPRLYYSQRYNTALQKWTDSPGFTTDQKTRGRIIDLFDVAIENDAIEIPIKAILDEALTFVLDERKNRADHLPGCNDDLLFASMIAHFVDGQVPMMAEEKPERRDPISWGHGPPIADDVIPSADALTREDIEMMFM